MPKPQSTNILCTIADYRHIIGNCQNISGFHRNDNSFIHTADGPWITKTGPVIRLLMLTSVYKTLLKETVTETQAVSGQWHITCNSAVQEAGGEAAQPSVPESIIFNILHGSRIHTLFLQGFHRFIKKSHTEQIVIYQSAD